MTEIPIPTKRRVQAPTPRPLDALASQVSLIRAWQGEHGDDLVHAMGASSRSTALIEAAGTGRRAADGLASLLNRATTIVVTDRMLDVVLDRMYAIRFGEALQHKDMLFPSGYILFPRPIDIGPLEDDDVDMTVFPRRPIAQFDAGFWTPMGITDTTSLHGFSSGVTSGIMYAQSNSLPLLQRHSPPADSGEPYEDFQEGIDRLERMGIKHAPIYSAGWAFDLSWDPAKREETFVLTPAGRFEREFWLTLWRTLRDEVFAPVRLRRQDHRAAARLGLIPEVVVADLRRVKHRNTEEVLPTGEVVMWNHRWLVRGHLRTIHKGTPQERKVFVREHVKGPENMPLISKDRVYRLSR
jgi:hypothetical protein